MSCPTRFVVDARKTAKEVKCAASRLFHDSARFFETFMHVYVCTYYVGPNIRRKKGEKHAGQVSGRTCRTCVQIFRVHLLKMAWTF